MVDWTFAEAPAADEPPPPEMRSALQKLRPAPQRTASPRRFGHRTWLLPCALVMLALALTIVFPRLETWRTRRAVEGVIERQEQARLAGDWTGVRDTFKDPAGSWADLQVQRLASAWQAAAFGLPGARLDSQAGRVGQYQVLGPGFVRADVVRVYVLVDGSRAAFALSQFYQFSSSAWHQVPAPGTPTDDLEQRQNDRVYLHYNPADADFAASVGGDLDGLLARACADWVCPADLRVAVVFRQPGIGSGSGVEPAGSLSGSLTFEMLLARDNPLPGLVVNLPTREWGGYPADAAAVEAVRRVVAVQALTNVAERLSGGVPAVSGPIRPFLYALVVRELARLGVEPPQLLAIQTVNPILKPEQLWSLPALGTASEPALPAALALLNRLLPGRPLADEKDLLHSLDAAPDTVSWLATGLRLTQTAARARMAAAHAVPFPAVERPSKWLVLFNGPHFQAIHI